MINNLIVMLTVNTVLCTVDVDLPEMKFLADHLKPEECRRLAAALHFKSYETPNALDTAEGQISQDIPCLRLLLHWNSKAGEGKGETHEMLFRRLKQIGRDDLADWLGETVFHELGQDLKRSLEPFEEMIEENIVGTNMCTTPDQQMSKQQEQNSWLPFDTICWVLILALILTTFVLLCRLVYTSCRTTCKCKAATAAKTKKRFYGKYEKMETQCTNVSESESEDKFDIRKKDDPALKLMGV